MKIKTILVTGGCGFIGTSLIARLLEKNFNPTIRVLDNFCTGTPDDLYKIFDYSLIQKNVLNHKLFLIEGDIRDFKTVCSCTKGVDCIIHLAANTGVNSSVKDPLIDMECNIIGTFNMLEAARLNGVKKFIFASSSAPVGSVKPPIHEKLAPHPTSPYGASKLAGEGYCSAYYQTFNIDTLCLRFSNVYGPMSTKKTSVVAAFIKQALNGEPCVIYGDGTQTRDFLYIGDLVDAVILGMSKNIGGETFQVATGREHSIEKMVKILGEILKEKNRKTFDIRYELPRKGDIKYSFSDTTKAQTVLGWKAQVPLREGLEKTIDYFLKRMKA